MAFVYRYSTKEGIPKYIGMVNGNNRADLLRRIKEHSREPKFAATPWIIDYIGNLSITDAHILEGHFIGVYENLFNVSKQNWGPSSLCCDHIPDWKPLAEIEASSETVYEDAPKSPDGYLSAREFAALNNISEQAVYKRIRNGTLATVQRKVNGKSKTFICMGEQSFRINPNGVQDLAFEKYYEQLRAKDVLLSDLASQLSNALFLLEKQTEALMRLCLQNTGG